MPNLISPIVGASDGDTWNCANLIAIYLPQFHPIPENDLWWGKGFTEWTNVTKARPVVPGHYQPHLPADLGFYDLRLPEVRLAQAEMARKYGIRGFCYYHYWFMGKRLLQRPFEEVLASGEPDFPFCLCWANENWSRRWDGQERELLMAQRYSPEDDVAHIRSLFPAFADYRYIRIDGKPLFLVYNLSELPDPKATAGRWRREVERAGLGEIFLCTVESANAAPWLDPRTIGFDAAMAFTPRTKNLGPLIGRDDAVWSRKARIKNAIRRVLRGRPAAQPPLVEPNKNYYRHAMYDYNNVVAAAMDEPLPEYPTFPCVTPAWDNSARRKEHGLVILNSTPEKYQQWLAFAISRARASLMDSISASEQPIVFINAWNEWAEGNHLEPCAKWGSRYLEATRDALLGAERHTSEDNL